jgi:hypothetical protein
MFNYFKAISLAMAILADLGSAIDPASEEGANLSQKEIVRLAVRAVFRVAGSFGARLANVKMNDDEFAAMVKEEVENAFQLM